MSEENELPKVGEWWWYGYCTSGGCSALKKCKVCCIGDGITGVVFDNERLDCVPTTMLIGKCVDVEIGVSNQKPWWRFW